MFGKQEKFISRERLELRARTKSFWKACLKSVSNTFSLGIPDPASSDLLLPLKFQRVLRTLPKG